MGPFEMKAYERLTRIVSPIVHVREFLIYLSEVLLYKAGYKTDHENRL